MKCVLCGTTQFSFIHKSRPPRLSVSDGGQVGKCVHCGLVQVMPMPSEKEINELYYDDMAHFEPYIAQIPVHQEYFRKKIQEIKKRGTLLDIGCAMGVLLEEAKKAGFQAQGIDISRDAVMFCRKKKLDVLEGTLTSAGKKLINNSFDAVTAFEIIEHERDPLGMMTRVHTLLKNGGIAVLTTPNHDSIWRKCMGKWWVGYHHPEHVTFWNPGSLTFLMKKAGFKNIEVRHDTPRPFPLSFVLTRGADYLPWLGFFLRPTGRFLDRFNLINPINPWDDLLVIGKK